MSQTPPNIKRLIAVKVIHTLIWVIFVTIIAFVLWSGLTGNISTGSWLAVLAVTGEGIVLLIFKGRCPLTLIARKYSDSKKENFDIYLPRKLARYNQLIFGILFSIGAVLMLLRTFTS